MTVAMPFRRRITSTTFTAALVLGAGGLPAKADTAAVANQQSFIVGELVPTGSRITPTAAPGAIFEGLNPGLENFPDYLADHAVKTATSPDGTTMLVLTSGYNRLNDETGSRDPAASNEYVFIYDITNGAPVQVQVVQVPNTFNGIAWNPRGTAFYVSGGVDDNVHVYAKSADLWVEDGDPIALGHDAGLGISVRPLAAGVAVSSEGDRLLVTNYENDSVSLIDLTSRSVVAELDLRPGVIDPADEAVPGGEYPFAVIFKGGEKAYVTSQRDREVVVLRVEDAGLELVSRIPVAGQPTNMVLDRDQERLFVACDNSDSVVVIDTDEDVLLEEIPTLAPEAVFANAEGFRGANPNGLALSPNENLLFVTNGGTNAVAVIRLGEMAKDEDKRPSGDDEDEGRAVRESRVIGLVPTGWYPNHVSVSPDGEWLYVVNGKDNAGPNPDACRDTLSIVSGSLAECASANQYVWQLHKAGMLSLPVPSAKELARLTWQVAYNNQFPSVKNHDAHQAMMEFLRDRIDHVIYVVKENRTYDQLLGALPIGNGDPDLAILAPYAPNHLQWALDFVTLDNFYDSGETSNTGWNWTTAARATDFTEKTAPVNYAGRGLTYDWEGYNRNINVGLPTLEERIATNPATPDDPNLLPGTADVAAPDSSEGEAGAGYLWDSAIRGGLSVRNYGFYGANSVDVSRTPYADGIEQFLPDKQALMDKTDRYFRGYDMNYPDYWRYKEWEREYDQFVASGEMPNLMLVRMPHDHFGNFSTALDGVSTVETQMADNDYATALIVEKVANGSFADNTLVFIIEDDAQNGGDHVDAHRSIAYIVGPYVKQGALISTHYTTVSMLRTIEDVLGIEPMGLYDGLAEPMADLFDRRQRQWTYQAIVPEILYTTDLAAYVSPTDATVATAGIEHSDCYAKSRRSAEFWQEVMHGQDFGSEDNLDAWKFNRRLWDGLRGEDVPEPLERHGRDMRADREELLKAHKARLDVDCGNP